MAALLYAALARVGDPRAAALAAGARETAAVNLIRPAVLAQVMARFEDAGVCYAVYKGAALTDQLPELRAVRATSDADVMVLPEDFERARGALLATGFEEQRASESVSIGWNNERVFVRRAPPELHVDLHKGLHRAPLFANLARAAVLESTHPSTGGTGLRYAPLTLAPLLIAAHRAKHGYSADARELIDLRALFAHTDAVGFDALVTRALALDMAGALYAVWTVYRWWWDEAAAPETQAYARLRRGLGRRAAWIDRLVAMDCPGDHNKPWRQAPFLKMYLPMPLLTGHRFTPIALAGVHVGLRSLDVLVGGRESLGTLPPFLRRR